MANALLSLFAQASSELHEGPLKTFLERVSLAAGAITGLSNVAPLSLGVADPGTSTDASRGDHVHAHGDQGGGTEHTLGQRSPGAAGFVSPVDLDQIDLNTFAINTILVALSTLLSNTNPLQLGTAAPGASGQASRADHVHDHGNLAGGALHALATTLAAGFMSPADVTLLNLLAPLVTPTNQLVARPGIAGPGLTTRAPGAVFEGSQIEVPKRAQIQNLFGRLTGFTTLGAGLRVALYQVPGGAATGVAAKLAEATVLPAGVGAQDITLNFGAPFLLEQGVAYLLYGRPNATAGVTLRTWAIGTIERLTTTVPAGLPPLTFTTAIASTVAGPATLNVPAALVASVLSPAFCGRFGP